MSPLSHTFQNRPSLQTSNPSKGSNSQPPQNNHTILGCYSIKLIKPLVAGRHNFAHTPRYQSSCIYSRFDHACHINTHTHTYECTEALTFDSYINNPGNELCASKFGARKLSLRHSLRGLYHTHNVRGTQPVRQSMHLI